MQSDSFSNLPDLPSTPRPKRTRTPTQDPDVDLDSFFRLKRFMTDAVTKEMEDVVISDQSLPTSPSRTSTLARLAEKGPSRSNIAGVLDFDSPKLSISANSGRRRHLVVTSANSPQLNRSGSFGDLHMGGSNSASMSEDYDFDEEDERLEHNYLDWRLPMSPRPSIPQCMPVEDALRGIIEKKKENEAKAIVLHRTPSEIIKDAAQNAIYARLRASPQHTMSSRFPPSSIGSRSPTSLSQVPFTNFTKRGSWSVSTASRASSSAPSPSTDIADAGDPLENPNSSDPNNFARIATPPLSTGQLHPKKRSIVIEELPEDDDTSMAQSPTLKASNRFNKRSMPDHLRQTSPSPTFRAESGSGMLTSSAEIARDEMEGENGIFEFSHSPTPQAPYRASFGDYMLTDDAMAFQNMHSPTNGGLRSSFASHSNSGFHSGANGGYFPSRTQEAYEPSNSTAPFETQAEYGNSHFRTSPPPRFSLFHGDHHADPNAGMDFSSTSPATPPMRF